VIDNPQSNAPRPTPVEPAAPPPAQTLRLPAYKPVVTYVIIGVTVFVYLLQIATKYFLGVDLPGALGVKSNELIIAGQLWRLFTPMLLHDDSNFMHIAFNMYFLYIVGSRVERISGHGRFLVLYILSGFAGDVLSFLLSPYPAWGASGALFGLLGTEAVMALQNRSLLVDNGRALLNSALTVAAINIVIGFAIGADNWGHLGGFLGGAMFSWFAGAKFSIQGLHPQLQLVDERGGREILNASVLTFAAFSVLAAVKIFGIL
jgi:rhomboid protease GluP